jgi:hypothetical protein
VSPRLRGEHGFDGLSCDCRSFLCRYLDEDVLGDGSEEEVENLLIRSQPIFIIRIGDFYLLVVELDNGLDDLAGEITFQVGTSGDHHLCLPCHMVLLGELLRYRVSDHGGDPRCGVRTTEQFT